MLRPFTIKNKKGKQFSVVCKQCPACLELQIFTQTKKEVGFLRFNYLKEFNSVKVLDFQIEGKFSRNGLGTQVFYILFRLFKEQGFNSVVGICKSSHRPLSERENLVKWYEGLGFTLTRESNKEVPGYMGKLSKIL